MALIFATTANANCINTVTGNQVSNTDHLDIWPVMETMLESARLLGWANEKSSIAECMIGERLGFVLGNGDRVLFDPNHSKYLLITRAAWDGSWPPNTTCYDMQTAQFFSSDLSCGDY